MKFLSYGLLFALCFGAVSLANAHHHGTKTECKRNCKDASKECYRGCRDYDHWTDRMSCRRDCWDAKRDCKKGCSEE